VNSRDFFLGLVLPAGLSVVGLGWNFGGLPVTDVMEVRNPVTRPIHPNTVAR